MGDNNAQGQIQVRVSVTTAEALANLKAFVNQADGTMNVIRRSSNEVEEGFGNIFQRIGQNRMALMEFGHVARASFDGMLAGMSPVRLMLMELPRIVQATAFAGLKISIAGIATELATWVPLLGTAFLGWKAIHDELAKGLPMETFLVKENDELKKQVTLLKDLGELRRAGVIDQSQYYRLAFQPGASISMRDMMYKGLAVPSKSGGEMSETAKAQIEISKIQGEINQTTDEGGRKIQELTDKFEKLKDGAAAAGIILMREGKMSKDEFDKLTQSISDAGDAQVNRLVMNLNFDNQQKNRQKADEVAAKSNVYFAQIVADQRTELERRLTDETATFVGSRLELAQNEFNERMDLATRMLYAGEVSEKQYNAIVQEAINERDQMRKAENDKTIQRLQEQRKEEQRQIEQSMRNDWRTTSAQKYQNLNDAGYSRDKSATGPNPNSFQEQFVSQMVQIQDQWGTMAQQMGKIFSSNINNAIQSVARSLTGLIMGTMTWKQALQSIETTILSDLINAIIKMFEQWIVGLILQYTVGKALAASGLAVDVGIAAGESAVWAAPATLATIASYGGAAYSAPGIINASILETMASVAGREFGGPVTAGTPYVVGERRPELFVPSQSGTILPYVPSTSTGTAQGGSQVGDQKSVEVHVHNWPDERAANKHARDNPEFAHIMVNKVKRYVTPYRPK